MQVASPLLQLPAELRLRLYECVAILAPTAVIEDPEHDRNDASLGYCPRMRAVLGPFTETCRAVRRECIPVMRVTKPEHPKRFIIKFISFDLDFLAAALDTIDEIPAPVERHLTYHIVLYSPLLTFAESGPRRLLGALVKPAEWFRTRQPAVYVAAKMAYKVSFTGPRWMQSDLMEWEREALKMRQEYGAGPIQRWEYELVDKIYWAIAEGVERRQRGL